MSCEGKCDISHVAVDLAVYFNELGSALLQRSVSRVSSWSKNARPAELFLFEFLTSGRHTSVYSGIRKWENSPQDGWME